MPVREVSWIGCSVEKEESAGEEKDFEERSDVVSVSRLAVSYWTNARSCSPSSVTFRHIALRVLTYGRYIVIQLLGCDTE